MQHTIHEKERKGMVHAVGVVGKRHTRARRVTHTLLFFLPPPPPLLP